MILWIKYKKRILDEIEALKAGKISIPESRRYLWTWILPGDYELWTMGKDNRYIVSSDDQDTFDNGDFFTTDSKNEMKIYLDSRCLTIGSRVGFSECVYDINSEMKNNKMPYTLHFWVGYDLIEGIDIGSH